MLSCYFAVHCCGVTFSAYIFNFYSACVNGGGEQVGVVSKTKADKTVSRETESEFRLYIDKH